MDNPFDSIIESSEFGEEFFVAEFQSRLANMLDMKGISRAELARKLDVSRARVSQIFSDDASNFTLRLLFRSFVALGEQPVIVTKSEHERLKSRAEAADQISPPPSHAKVKNNDESATVALLAELLRANIQTSRHEQEKPSRRNDSTRLWSNVVPFREKSCG